MSNKCVKDGVAKMTAVCSSGWRQLCESCLNISEICYGKQLEQSQVLGAVAQTTLLLVTCDGSEMYHVEALMT
jgi:hypothetical protein